MKKLLLCLFAQLSLATLLATSATAQTAAPAKAADQKSADATIRAAIAKKFPDMKVDDVRSSPMAGIYEVQMGGEVAYISADGRFLIAGDMYEIDSRTNVTETGRQKSRVQALSKLDEKDMIVFKPQKVKYTITVFTDVECGYCRKLHSEIAQLNDRGVQVRYLAYPRAGPGTEDWAKMEAVWCSMDRKKAITDAKAGKAVKAQQCTTPIAKQFKLGEQLGVRGTPAIFTDSGEYIGGYLAPDQMIGRLDGTAQ
ncbi:DsbC family protein [Steroidobacter cummioxidans]|uniref:DsbC family protein n=1 Tax=Steroidobacter cummioxidans TaxID=1803913 RepID=UPI000E323760|nr:DsbC family protein [Steroidobacter cummioxidans]